MKRPLQEGFLAQFRAARPLALPLLASDRVLIRVPIRDWRT